MDGDGLKKITPGQKLKAFSANWYNGTLDAINATKNGRLIPGERFGLPSTGLILVQNATGADQAAGAVLGLDDRLWRTAYAFSAMAPEPVYTGIVPEKRHRGHFCVLLGPLAAGVGSSSGSASSGDLANGAIGLACVSGICRVKVLVVTLSPTVPIAPRADIRVGDTSSLIVSSFGSAQTLRYLGSGGLPWEYVRLGNAPTGLVPVELSNDGGANGDSTHEPTWTYSISDYETIVATGKSPECPMRTYGPHTPGTRGTAYIDNDGDYHLWTVNEVPGLRLC